MPPDATDTKRRLLNAARREFAEFGLAGARIDRIAEKAGANKRSIYMHFGPKEQLFDLVISSTLAAMAEAVPFIAGDLAAYATELFDYLLTEGETLRLIAWANLERPTATTEEQQTYGAKVAALSTRYGNSGADVLALTLGLVTAWANASPALIPPSSHNNTTSNAHRRRMLADAVRSVESTFVRLH
ncbi:TetR family transcriptional regulator [Tsukamurella sp. DT100]|uniref:TetR family transcriptional regulator n=1 Tax=Tsukamurella sp. DT100 TaxID=3393415 RepID=UPI003CF019E2